MGEAGKRKATALLIQNGCVEYGPREYDSDPRISLKAGSAAPPRSKPQRAHQPQLFETGLVGAGQTMTKRSSAPPVRSDDVSARWGRRCPGSRAQNSSS